MQFHKRSLCLSLLFGCLIATLAFADEKVNPDGPAEESAPDHVEAPHEPAGKPEAVPDAPAEEPHAEIPPPPRDTAPTELATVDPPKSLGPVEPVENSYNLLRIFTGLYYQNTYQEINNYLVDHVPTDDAESNMREAINWYNKELAKRSIFNKAIREGLKQFTSLSKIGESNKCNRNTYAILRKNDRGTRGKVHKKRSKLGLFKRVEKVVYDYSINHALDCVPKYPSILKERYAQMDPVKVKTAEKLIDEIINSFLYSKKKLANENKRYATYTLVKSLKSITNKRTSKIALDTLDEYARDDPEKRFLKPVLNEKKGIMEVRKDKVRELVEKYLVAPCKYYVDQLGLNVFIPAHYDLSMLEVEDRYKEDDEAALEFLLGWSRYHVCNLIADKDLNNLTKGICKLAELRKS